MHRVAVFVVVALFAPTAQTAHADADLTWISPQPTGETLRAMAGNDESVCAVGDGGTLLCSRDNGTTWRRVTTDTTAALRAVWNQGALYWVVGEDGTIRTSADHGEHWRRIDAPAPDALVAVWGRGAHDVFIASHEGRLYRSRDEGATFEVSRPFGDANEGIATLVGVGESTLYVGGTFGALLVSKDGGQSFEVRWPSSNARTIKRLVVNHEGALLAAVAFTNCVTHAMCGDRLLYSPDGKSVDFAAVTPPLPLRQRQTELAIGGERAVYAVTLAPIGARESPRLLLSRDGGHTFAVKGPIPHALDPVLWSTPRGSLFLLGDRGSMWRSTNRGATWEERTTRSVPPAPFIGIVTDGARSLWIVTRDGLVWRSRDGGATFASARVGNDVRAIERDENGLLEIYGDNGEWRSGDDGLTWKRISPQSSREHGRPAVALDTLPVAPQNDHWIFSTPPRSRRNELYCVVRSAGAAALMRSRDGGTSWKLERELPPSTRDVAVVGDKLWFVGFGGLVFVL